MNVESSSTDLCTEPTKWICKKCNSRISDEIKCAVCNKGYSKHLTIKVTLAKYDMTDDFEEYIGSQALTQKFRHHDGSQSTHACTNAHTHAHTHACTSIHIHICAFICIGFRSKFPTFTVKSSASFCGLCFLAFGRE